MSTGIRLTYYIQCCIIFIKGYYMALNHEIISKRLLLVDIIPIGEYTKIKEPLKMKCVLCNTEFVESPKSYLSGKRHSCNSNRSINSSKKMKEFYNSDLCLALIKEYEILPNIELLSNKYNIPTFKIYNLLKYHKINLHKTKNDNYFNTIDNEEKAYIFGFLMADGHNYIKIDKNGNKDYKRIGIKLSSKDIDILEKICKSIDYDHNIKTYTSHTRFKTKNKIYEYNNEFCKLEINSIVMCKRLEQIGMVNNKSNILEFPKLEYLPYELYKHFIRGYIDGNGCLYMGVNKSSPTVYYQFNISILSTKMVLDVISDIILRETGEKSNKLTLHANKRLYYLNYSGIRIKKILEWLYGDSTIYLNRKYNKHLDIIKKIDELSL